MVAARVILGLVMAGTAVSNLLVWHWGWQESGWAIAWAVVSAMLFTAAVTVMVITFVNFQQKGGKFVVDSKSLIARIMVWFYGDKITICSLFWTTALLITGSIVGFVLLLTVLLAIVESGWVETLKVVLLGAVIITAMILFAWGAISAGDYLKKHENPTVRRIGNIADTTVLPIMLLGAMAVLLGFLVYDTGVWKFLMGLGIACAIIAGAVGLVFGVIATVKSVRESSVGKILISGWHHVKSRTCPIVSVMDLK